MARSRPRANECTEWEAIPKAITNILLIINSRSRVATAFFFKVEYVDTWLKNVTGAALVLVVAFFLSLFLHVFQGALLFLYEQKCFRANHTMIMVNPLIK
jgi:hypothetical protein